MKQLLSEELCQDEPTIPEAPAAARAQGVIRQYSKDRTAELCCTLECLEPTTGMKDCRRHPEAVLGGEEEASVTQ